MSFSLDSTLAPSLRLELSDSTLASNYVDSTLATTYIYIFNCSNNNIQFLVMFLIVLFGITGNASIIIIILRNKLLRLQPTNLFLLNMAVSDFINLCICPILYIFKRDILFTNYYLPKWCCIATPYLTGTTKNEYYLPIHLNNL